MAIIFLFEPMSYIKCLVFIICIFLLFPVKAQKTIKILVKDIESSQPVEGASITSNNFNYHAVSTSDGLVSLVINDNDSLKLLVRHVAYNEKYIAVNGVSNKIEIKLTPIHVNIASVNVTAAQSKRNTHSLSSVFISSKEFQEIPTHLGESDVIKILEMQPGVVRTNELNPAINVRGGSGGHNSFVLGGQAIFNPNHLLGILSTFNSDLIESASMIKDGYQPALGGSLSSFIEVKNRIGNKEKFSGKAGIGLLSSRLAIEGPLKKEKISFLFGARRSYFDLFAKSYNKINDGKKDFSPLPEYNFQDYQLKFHAKVNENWFGEIEMFHSSDKLDLLKEKNDKRLLTNWCNQFVSFHIKHYSKKSYNFHFVSGLGKYKFDLDRDYNNFLSVISQTNVWNNKVDFVYNGLNRLEFNTGLFFDLYKFKYHNILRDTDILLKENSSNKNAAYLGTYLNVKYQLTNKFVINLGSRINIFKQNNYIKEYSPRVSATYTLSEGLSLNANYGVTHQFNHLLSTYGMNLPNDIWYPSNSKIPSEEARQFAFGLEKKWIDTFTIRMSSFIKTMKNVLDYNDGADLLFNQVEDDVLLGIGKSKGFELELAWKTPALNSKLFYSLADTWRKFSEINKGEKYSPPYDIKHTINILSNLRISSNLSFSASWAFASGQSISFPVNAVVVQGSGTENADTKIIPVYGNRYNLRMPSTHRLDLSIRYTQKRKFGRSIVSVGVYNVYNRSNPYFVYFDTEKNGDGTRKFLPKQKALIPFLPTISYTYEFK